MITRITSHRDCWSFILHEISMEWISSLLLTYYINNVTFLITFSKKSLLHFAYFCSRIKATNGKPMEMIERFMNNHKCETSNVKYLIIIHIYVSPRIFHAQSVSMISLIFDSPTFSNFLPFSWRVLYWDESKGRRSGCEQRVYEASISIGASISHNSVHFMVIGL